MKNLGSLADPTVVVVGRVDQSAIVQLNLIWSKEPRLAIIGDGRIITDVFDKRTGMEIYKNVRKFPHRSSVMSNKIRYNVVTSQLIRYARRCTRYRDFLRNSAKLRRAAAVDS